jgi:hypothetical protein
MAHHFAAATFFVLAILPLAAAADGKPYANYTSGNDLYGFCDSSQPADFLICAGYVSGVVDTVGRVQREQGFCLFDIPLNVPRQQAADVVAKYLREHPETRHYSAVDSVVPALKQAFPCNSN